MDSAVLNLLNLRKRYRETEARVLEGMRIGAFDVAGQEHSLWGGGPGLVTVRSLGNNLLFLTIGVTLLLIFSLQPRFDDHTQKAYTFCL